VAAIVAIAVVLLLVRYFSGRGTAVVESTEVSRTDITESISISGKIDAERKADLTFQTPGKLAWVGVKSGDTVRAGQAIASLETLPLSVVYQQALNTWKDRQATAEAVEDSLQDHDTDETFAQKAQRTTAQVARDNAYDAVRAAEYNLRQATLITPFAGIVTTAVPAYAGINVSPATATYAIADPTSLYFLGEITEADVAKIKQGQEVKLSLDAYPDKSLESKVGRIDFASFINSTGATAYHVKISLPKDSDNLKLGMNGDAEILLESRKDILFVPVTAIVEEEDKAYVWKIVDGKAVKVEVKTGISSLEVIEIMEGLNEGEKIIVNPSVRLKEGQKVQTS
jgi:RND family efflux transporter MFP subunit